MLCAIRLPPSQVFQRASRARNTLILAEHAIRACAGLAAAGSAGAAHGRGSVCSLGDGARSSADQPLHVSAALGANFDGSVRHFLALFKTARAFIAKIFVGGHGDPLLRAVICEYCTGSGTRLPAAVGRLGQLDLRLIWPPFRLSRNFSINLKIALHERYDLLIAIKGD